VRSGRSATSYNATRSRPQGGGRKSNIFTWIDHGISPHAVVSQHVTPRLTYLLLLDTRTQKSPGLVFNLSTLPNTKSSLSM
jgi:hypothetical protein